jgi:hypothetical protein
MGQNMEKVLISIVSVVIVSKKGKYVCNISTSHVNLIELFELASFSRTLKKLGVRNLQEFKVIALIRRMRNQHLLVIK